MALDRPYIYTYVFVSSYVCLRNQLLSIEQSLLKESVDNIYIYIYI